MKIILLTLAIYAHAYAVSGASTGTNHTRRSIKQVVEEKCFENSHSKYAFENLNENSHTNYVQCEVKAFSKPPPHPVEEHDEFCRYFKENGYYTCMKNLAADVLPCLDKTEIFLPHMILKAYNTTFNKLCGTNGYFMTQYIFNELQNNEKCLSDAMAALTREGRCFENLNVLKNFEENIIIDLNKHDYCIDMESFVSCATELLEEKCNKDFSLIIDNISELVLGVCKTK